MSRQFLFHNRRGAGFKESITVTRHGQHTQWIAGATAASVLNPNRSGYAGI